MAIQVVIGNGYIKEIQQQGNDNNDSCSLYSKLGADFIYYSGFDFELK